jgi:hypothetical protein
VRHQLLMLRCPVVISSVTAVAMGVAADLVVLMSVITALLAAVAPVDIQATEAALPQLVE